MRPRACILPVLAGFFGDRFGLQEKQQIVLPAGFGIRARHVEAAEGVRADHRAGALAVQIQIADVKSFFGFANLGKLKYFAHVREFLMERSAAWGRRLKVVVVKTPPTSSLPKRAARILETIAATCRARRPAVHLIGHSSGGVDVRLATAPNVSLPTDVDVERFAACVRTVVSVAAICCASGACRSKPCSSWARSSLASTIWR